MKPITVAVVILNWNGASLLRKFLPSVIQYSDQADIYVADNASTDESISVLKEEFPQVKIIQNDGNYGYAKGYNLALREVSADVLALVNSDIEVTENWLQPIINQFENQAEIGIIQPKILDYKNKALFEYAGASGGFIDQFGYPFCRGRIFDTIEKDENQYNNKSSIFWASGACFFIRKSIFDDLKGFDDSFFAHQEEIDLCWRAFNQGHEIIVVPESVVYHVGGATLNEGNPQKTYLNFRNSLLMLVKNLPSHKAFIIIFLRLCLDGIAGIRFVLNGKPAHCWAIIRAHFGFYKRLNSALKKRSQHQRLDYFLVKNLLWSYFIQSKKTFKELI